MKRNYCSELKKWELEKSGITNITENGQVFRNNQPVKLIKNRSGYFCIWIWDFDQNGKRKKIIDKKNPSHYFYKNRLIAVSRAMWAWFFGSVPAGYTVDHVNNNKLDNRISLDPEKNNLQLLTPKENTNKSHENWNKCEKKSIRKTAEYYYKKLEKLEIEYQLAKQVKDPDRCHSLRSNICSIRARIRYLENHEEN